MLRRLLSSFTMTLLLVASGCTSKPAVQPCQRVKPPAPAAWMMQPAPDLISPLNGIISLSEVESSSPVSK
ncbi:hypothetical protein B2J69_13960 [Pantoea latae]|uniref:Lipoprotein Rz1 n=1 Tax=Pantoea latae TaxID=1964541 RepID=A0A1V9DET6_9GAMM|nr:hypothetical protein B2J69_13960 [Pantoea latae]